MANSLLLIYRFIACFPYQWVYRLGAIVGRLTAQFSPSYRERLSIQIQAAGFMPYRDLAIAHAGRSALEIAWLWFNSADKVAQHVRLKGWQHVVGSSVFAEATKVLEAPDEPPTFPVGVIILTPHLGGFEVIGKVCAFQRLRLTALFRPAKKSALQKVIEKGRASEFLDQVPASAQGVRQLLRALKQGGATCILPDQVPQKGMGVWVPFFGRSAYTMTLVGKLARNSGAKVVLASVIRDEHGFVCEFEPDTFLIADTDSIEVAAERCNLAMQYLIAKAPAQYYWSYNRYKSP